MHLYPCFDTDVALRCLLQNLARWDSSAVKAAFLTERADCLYFRAIRDGKVRAPGGEWSLISSSGEEAAVLVRGGEPCLYVFPGRQVVTRERLEILALTVDEPLPSGLPAEDVVTRILESGGVPVLSWAPGKWFLGRGRTVEDLIRRFKPGELLIGDTGLRPRLWPEPRPMMRARKAGFAVLAGSDPLPVPGEDVYAGSYVCETDVSFDEDRPVASMRAAFSTAWIKTTALGRRCGPIETLIRLGRHARAKRRT